MHVVWLMTGCCGLQECILPRCILSMEDALYCAHMLFVLADFATANFSFAMTVDKVCLELIALLRCCTSQEASNVSIFLNEVSSGCLSQA
jgi:THO complex subunit 2